jgi:hypothetical protein
VTSAASSFSVRFLELISVSDPAVEGTSCGTYADVVDEDAETLVEAAGGLTIRDMSEDTGCRQNAARGLGIGRVSGSVRDLHRRL